MQEFQDNKREPPKSISILKLLYFQFYSNVINSELCDSSYDNNGGILDYQCNSLYFIVSAQPDVV